jgi:hypothetical protein
MKGQYITIENVLFFGIGLSMVILLYTGFSNISEKVKMESYEIELEKVGVFIRENIVNVYEIGKQTNSNITVYLRIPEKISDCIYKILLEDNKIKLICMLAGKTVELNLYGVDTNIKSGYLYSTQRILEIRYVDGVIEIM